MKNKKCKHKLKKISEGSVSNRGYSIPALFQCEKCNRVWTLDINGILLEDSLFLK